MKAMRDYCHNQQGEIIVMTSREMMESASYQLDSKYWCMTNSLRIYQSSGTFIAKDSRITSHPRWFPLSMLSIWRCFMWRKPFLDFIRSTAIGYNGFYVTVSICRRDTFLIRMSLHLKFFHSVSRQLSRYVSYSIFTIYNICQVKCSITVACVHCEVNYFKSMTVILFRWSLLHERF